MENVGVASAPQGMADVMHDVSSSLLQQQSLADITQDLSSRLDDLRIAVADGKDDEELMVLMTSVAVAHVSQGAKALSIVTAASDCAAAMQDLWYVSGDAPTHSQEANYMSDLRRALAEVHETGEHAYALEVLSNQGWRVPYVFEANNHERHPSPAELECLEIIMPMVSKIQERGKELKKCQEDVEVMLDKLEGDIGHERVALSCDAESQLMEYADQMRSLALALFAHEVLRCAATLREKGPHVDDSLMSWEEITRIAKWLAEQPEMGDIVKPLAPPSEDEARDRTFEAEPGSIQKKIMEHDSEWTETEKSDSDNSSPNGKVQWWHHRLRTKEAERAQELEKQAAQRRAEAAKLASERRAPQAVYGEHDHHQASTLESIDEAESTCRSPLAKSNIDIGECRIDLIMQSPRQANGAQPRTPRRKLFESSGAHLTTTSVTDAEIVDDRSSLLPSTATNRLNKCCVDEDSSKICLRLPSCLQWSSHFRALVPVLPRNKDGELKWRLQTRRPRRAPKRKAQCKEARKWLLGFGLLDEESGWDTIDVEWQEEGECEPGKIFDNDVCFMEVQLEVKEFGTSGRLGLSMEGTKVVGIDAEAAVWGWHPGDTIVAVNGQRVNVYGDLVQYSKAVQPPVVFTVRRLPQGHPLSAPQQLALALRGPGIMLNSAACMRIWLSGHLDTTCLKAAVESLLDRHDVLRLNFYYESRAGDNQRVRQRLLKAQPCDDIIQFVNVADEKQAKRLAARVDQLWQICQVRSALARSPEKLGMAQLLDECLQALCSSNDESDDTGYLAHVASVIASAERNLCGSNEDARAQLRQFCTSLRIVCISISAGDTHKHLLVIQSHPLLFDGWSLGQLWCNLAWLYRSSIGEPIPMGAPEPCLLATSVLTTGESFLSLRHTKEVVPPSNLNFSSASQSGSLAISIDSSLVDQLSTVTAVTSLPVAAILLSAWAIAVAKLHKRQEVFLLMPCRCQRSDSKSGSSKKGEVNSPRDDEYESRTGAGCLGLNAEILPIRTAVPDEKDFNDEPEAFVKTVFRVFLEALASARKGNYKKILDKGQSYDAAFGLGSEGGGWSQDIAAVGLGGLLKLDVDAEMCSHSTQRCAPLGLWLHGRGSDNVLHGSISFDLSSRTAEEASLLASDFIGVIRFAAARLSQKTAMVGCSEPDTPAKSVYVRVNWQRSPVRLVPVNLQSPHTGGTVQHAVAWWIPQGEEFDIPVLQRSMCSLFNRHPALKQGCSVVNNSMHVSSINVENSCDAQALLDNPLLAFAIARLLDVAVEAEEAKNGQLKALSDECNDGQVPWGSLEDWRFRLSELTARLRGHCRWLPDGEMLSYRILHEAMDARIAELQEEVSADERLSTVTGQVQNVLIGTQAQDDVQQLQEWKVTSTASSSHVLRILVEATLLLCDIGVTLREKISAHERRDVLSEFEQYLEDVHFAISFAEGVLGMSPEEKFQAIARVLIIGTREGCSVIALQFSPRTIELVDPMSKYLAAQDLFRLYEAELEAREYWDSLRPGLSARVLRDAIQDVSTMQEQLKGLLTQVVSDLDESRQLFHKGKFYGQSESVLQDLGECSTTDDTTMLALSTIKGLFWQESPKEFQEVKEPAREPSMVDAEKERVVGQCLGLLDDVDSLKADLQSMLQERVPDVALRCVYESPVVLLECLLPTIRRRGSIAVDGHLRSSVLSSEHRCAQTRLRWLIAELESNRRSGAWRVRLSQAKTSLVCALRDMESFTKMWFEFSKIEHDEVDYQSIMLDGQEGYQRTARRQKTTVRSTRRVADLSLAHSANRRGSMDLSMLCLPAAGGSAPSSTIKARLQEEGWVLVDEREEEEIIEEELEIDTSIWAVVAALEDVASSAFGSAMSGTHVGLSRALRPIGNWATYGVGKANAVIAPLAGMISATTAPMVAATTQVVQPYVGSAQMVGGRAMVSVQRLGANAAVTVHSTVSCGIADMNAAVVPAFNSISQTAGVSMAKLNATVAPYSVQVATSTGLLLARWNVWTTPIKTQVAASLAPIGLGINQIVSPTLAQMSACTAPIHAQIQSALAPVNASMGTLMAPASASWNAMLGPILYPDHPISNLSANMYVSVQPIMQSLSAVVSPVYSSIDAALTPIHSSLGANMTPITSAILTAVGPAAANVATHIDPVMARAHATMFPVLAHANVVAIPALAQVNAAVAPAVATASASAATATSQLHSAIQPSLTYCHATMSGVGSLVNESVGKTHVVTGAAYAASTAITTVNATTAGVAAGLTASLSALAEVEGKIFEAWEAMDSQVVNTTAITAAEGRRVTKRIANDWGKAKLRRVVTRNVKTRQYKDAEGEMMEVRFSEEMAVDQVLTSKRRSQASPKKALSTSMKALPNLGVHNTFH